MDIEQRTKRSLEWEKLKHLLAAEASSAWSTELCLELPTHTESKLIEMLLAETAEALSIQSAGFNLSQDGLPELREVLQRARAGAQLAGKELLDLRTMLLLCRRTKGQLTQLNASDFPQMSVFTPDLHAQENLVRAIEDVFDENGNVRDDASPLLRQLKKEVARLNNQAREEVLKIINSSTLSKALQEPIYTTRNGRYVVPVQASMRHIIQGIVHDSSGSGLTVYVEPMAVVELTNKIRLKESEIEREIDRLLSELSARAQEVHEQLELTYRALVEIDFIAARARLSMKYKGTLPQLSLDGEMKLRSARHPLLVLQNLASAAPVIANDIILGGGVRTLIITGPNTGGKTVYLKTAGLLALMARGGLLLPVDNGSSIPIFSNVFADIGDEQSIEQSLSTFSSHMTNIVEIVRRSGNGTLVLLDEIGAGTDPLEGTVLARVILEHLNSSGAFVISTTHYGELKTIAYTTAGFINGSFEFDDKTLSPTYRLRIGIPGSSKAITIASRLGLDGRLVIAANESIASNKSDVQAIIEQLENKLKEAQQLEAAADQRLRDLHEKEARVEQQMTDLEKEREKLRQGTAGKMQQEFDQARDFIRSTIADLQRAPSMQKAQKLQQDMEVLRQELGWMEADVEEEKGGALVVGQTVKVKSLNQKGVIESLPEDLSDPKAEVTVRAASMKLKVPLSEVQPLQNAPAQPARSGPRLSYKTPNPAKQSSSRVSSSGAGLDVFVRTSFNSIDLRGQRVEEALANLESFIDQCFLERISPAMIIHGHGMGKVRAAVRKFLTESPYQATFRPGENYEGGDGVTIVQFS